MINVYINPGSGPVQGATLSHAEANIIQFVEDCRLEGITVARQPEMDERGRYGFTLTRGEVKHEVEMPGLPLQQVRWLDESSGSIMAFPRLYVDGSSWIWCFALLNEESDWQPDTE